MLINEYLILAYAIGLGLLLGYAVSLWVSYRSMSRRSRGDQS